MVDLISSLGRMQAVERILTIYFRYKITHIDSKINFAFYLNWKLAGYGIICTIFSNCNGKTFFFPVAKFYESLELPSSGFEYEQLANDYIKQYRNRFGECKLH